MITTSSAFVGSAFLLTLKSSRADVSVSASVIEVGTGSSTSVSLPQSSALSASGSYVYAAEFTPGSTGWYVVQYQAEDSVGTIVNTDVSRFYAAEATSGSGGSTDSSVSSGAASGGGTVVQASTVLNGTAGTLSFTVGTK